MKRAKSTGKGIWVSEIGTKGRKRNSRRGTFHKIVKRAARGRLEMKEASLRGTTERLFSQQLFPRPS